MIAGIEWRKSSHFAMMVMGERMHAFQHGLGQTGRFGEFLLLLGLLILAGGSTLLAMSYTGTFSRPDDVSGAAGDAELAGWLFVVQGLGFVVLSVLVMRLGWARHHDGTGW